MVSSLRASATEITTRGLALEDVTVQETSRAALKALLTV